MGLSNLYDGTCSQQKEEAARDTSLATGQAKNKRNETSKKVLRRPGDEKQEGRQIGFDVFLFREQGIPSMHTVREDSRFLFEAERGADRATGLERLQENIKMQNKTPVVERMKQSSFQSECG